MTREERLKALFDELERDAYNAEYHNYYYKEANQIIRKHFELYLPPAEGAEQLNENTISACLNIARGCHDYQGGHHDEKDNSIYHHGIQTVVNCLERLMKDKNLNDTQLNVVHLIGAKNSNQPTAEGAEEILEKYGEIGVYDIANKWAVLAKGNEVATRNAMVTDLYGLLNAHAQQMAEKMVEERDDLQKLMNDISEWSDKTFGSDQRNPAIVYHLKKEVDELITAIEKTNTLGGDPSVGVGEFGRQRTVTRVEYADCLMLLLDSAHHFGISAKELLSVTRGKLEINKSRKWGKPDENGVVEHIE